MGRKIGFSARNEASTASSGKNNDQQFRVALRWMARFGYSPH